LFRLTSTDFFVVRIDFFGKTLIPYVNLLRGTESVLQFMEAIQRLNLSQVRSDWADFYLVVYEERAISRRV
jgi:hypothetical protein